MTDPRQLQWRQIPACCAMMLEQKSIVMAYRHGYPWIPQEPEKNPDWADEKPTWMIACKHTEKVDKDDRRGYNGEIEWDDFCEAFFCPFCGKKLPEIVKREAAKIPKLLMKTDGYYCRTCKERGENCFCAPLTECWEQKT